MKKLSIILGVLSICSSLMAANKITGKVTDESTNQNIEYANVSLMTQDSSFIIGAATDSNGDFLLKEVKNGDYLLCISCIGYSNSYLTIRNLKANVQLGALPLSPDNVLLESVTVTASPVIKKTDRQIILPTEMQTKAASNGLTLLKNLQLSRILINPVDNSISLPGGDAVQLRINGIEVTQPEVTAIRPADVIRIEYIDNPGARYGNVSAVLNYIVKRRESGGNVSADLSNGISNTGYGEHNLSAKYNFNKSAISTTVYWGRRDLKWTRENYESFRFPEGLQENKELGHPTRMKYDDLNLNLNYSYQDNDKHFLNVALRNKYTHTPHSMSDRISTLTDGENHKGFHRINLETSIQIRPYKEYIALKITPFLNRFISYGNTYTHTHTNAGLRANLMAMYKNWALMAEMNTSDQSLWGETLTKDEKQHSIMVGYNTERWSLSVGVLNPFIKKYEMGIENLSKLAPYHQLAYSKNLSPLFMVNASFNLDFGKKHNTQNRRINNKDTDSGILSGNK